MEINEMLQRICSPFQYAMRLSNDKVIQFYHKRPKLGGNYTVYFDITCKCMSIKATAAPQESTDVQKYCNKHGNQV